MTRWLWKALLCLIFMGMLLPVSVEAQTQADKTSISSFVNSVAGTVYNMAWPTAQYRGARVDDVTSVAGGYDVLATFWGLSGFDGSSLWLQLVIELRSEDGLHDIRVKHHNAFLVAPFQTMKTLGNALVQMQQQYERDHPAAATAPNSNALVAAPSGRDALPPAGGACLANATSETIVFSYHWGTAEWTRVSLEPGKSYRMVWSYGTLRTTPKLSISYDSDFAPGYQEVTYDLDNLPAFDTSDCSRMKTYHFGIVDTKILVYVDR